MPRFLLALLFAFLTACPTTDDDPTDDDDAAVDDDDAAVDDDDAAVDDDDTAPDDDDTAPDDDDSDCSDECLVGEQRCNAFTIEACGIGGDGCTAWVSGVDCSTLQATCELNTNVATCAPVSAAGCADGTRNGFETDVDCGGPDCAACPADDSCILDADCVSGYCDPALDVCRPPVAATCNDAALNGDETDIDCGGPNCAPCAIDSACAEDADCTSGSCDTGGTDTCAQAGAPTCDDGATNGDETDGDCGGPTCAPCSLWATCALDGDCSSGFCDPATDTCGPAVGETCSDGLPNQDETDTDCGGTVCAACGIADACLLDTDCGSGFCDPASDTCAPASGETCSDGVLNQDETDVDCGGTACSVCGVDDACQAGSDCSTGYCDPSTDTCEVQSTGDCVDGILNQDETDVDCGGDTCAACPVGDACDDATDCSTGNCDVGGSDECIDASTPSCGDGLLNQDETDTDCGGDTCISCDLGGLCEEPDDCGSGNCDINVTDTCVDPVVESCGDGLLNQDEVEIDCGGSTCSPCDLPSYQTDEDFETGDYSLFPWSLGSDQPSGNEWTIETDPLLCYEGDFCARTSPLHQPGETTWFEITLSVREDTVVQFQAEVNTEPGEHVFRFYVDGALQVEDSGQLGWQQYSYPVQATGPNGPDRTFRFEYERSAFIDPNHPPYNEVRIDLIDMPSWNTPPTQPETLTPWDGSLTTNDSPTFHVVSEDPDYDAITYEIQYDSDPAFSLPISSGEITSQYWTPTNPLAPGTYFWRARSKDDSDYRWSAWTPTWGFTVDPTSGYDEVWVQNTGEQFTLNPRTDLMVTGDTVLPQSFTKDTGWGPSTTFYGGGSITQTFSSLPAAAVGASGTMYVDTSGDYGSSNEYCTRYVDNANFGNNGGNTTTTSIPGVGTYVNGDRSLDLKCTNSVYVSSGSVRMRMTYTATVEQGWMTSPLIDFAQSFPSQDRWEKVQLIGTGALVWQVFDANAALIPDAALPGNAAGFTERTMHLWDLDTTAYPQIMLQVMIPAGGQLDEWRVLGNTAYEWQFSHDGDPEGWTGDDFGSSPTLSVAGDTLLLEGFLPGNDPNIQYWFPQPVDSSRFSTLEVTLRTSNTYSNDDVTVYWTSNFGGFDVNRSFSQEDVFLFSYQDLVFDLTEVPLPPGQIWQGDIASIRLDAVEQFVDQLLDPSDGWFEIESIALY